MDRMDNLQVAALNIAASIVTTATKEGTPWDAQQKARLIGHLARPRLQRQP